MSRKQDGWEGKKGGVAFVTGGVGVVAKGGGRKNVQPGQI